MFLSDCWPNSIMWYRQGKNNRRSIAKSAEVNGEVRC